MTSTLTTNVDFEAGITRLRDRIDRGELCCRCGLGHGTLHPVAGSERVEHVLDPPGCNLIRTQLIALRHDLAVA